MKLWQFIRSNWTRAIDSGIQPELSTLELIRIRVVNGLAVLLTFIQLILILIRIYLGDGFSLNNLLNCSIGLLVLPILYLNSCKFYLAAKTTFYTGALILVTVICWNHAVYGYDSNTEIVLVAGSIFCVLLFDGPIKYFSFLAAIFCYFLIMLVRVNTGKLVIASYFDHVLNPI